MLSSLSLDRLRSLESGLYFAQNLVYINAYMEAQMEESFNLNNLTSRGHITLKTLQ